MGLAMALVAASAVADEIAVERDIAYRPDAADDYTRSRCKLDLYFPKSPEVFPFLVWFHGGGLQEGDKATPIAVDMANRFAAEGVAVASVNYRLSPEAQYPAYIEDAAASIAFVRKRMIERGGSPNRIFVSGHSAGGYLAAMVSLDPKYLGEHGLKLSDLAGSMPIAGQMVTHTTIRGERGIGRNQLIIDAAAPIFHASKAAPPFLCAVGGSDLPMRAEENALFAAAMKANGHTATTYLEVEGRSHSSIADRLGKPDDIVAKTMLEMIAKSAEQ
jgi:acetyl esterase/lipase